MSPYTKFSMGVHYAFTQIIKGQMQLTIGWLQFGRAYFIL